MRHSRWFEGSGGLNDVVAVGGGGWAEERGGVLAGLKDVVVVEGRPFGDKTGESHPPRFGP